MCLMYVFSYYTDPSPYYQNKNHLAENNIGAYEA